MTRAIQRDDAKALAEESEQTRSPAKAAPTEWASHLVEGPMTGKQLGRYLVGGAIGEGGMATVYLGFLNSDAGFEKVVALKCVHTALEEDPEFVSMFMDEARIASKVGHSNVVQIFDFGREENVHYLAMEYLAGLSFAGVLRELSKTSSIRDPTNRRMMLRALCDVCEGLHAAHVLKDSQGKDMGVVHRDVSPQNVFLTFEGTTKLIDFGIARARERLHKTSTGVIKGHFAYTSPEHVKAQPMDHRSDIWSLGVMLWEILLGKRLFIRDTTAQTLYAVMNDLVRRVDAVDPSISREMADVTARCLERDVEHRFASARELGRAIQAAAASMGPWPSKADVAEWLEELVPGAQAAQSDDVRRAWQMAQKETTKPSGGRRYGLFVLLGAIAIGGAAALWAGQNPDPVTVATAPVSQESPDESPPEERAQPQQIDLPAMAEMESTPIAAMATPMATSMRRRGMRARPEMSTSMEPGQLTVVTPNGWAEVWLGGRKLGVTPLRTTLPGGSHTLRVRPFGMRPDQRVRVDVPGGGTVRRSVRLRN